jgi:hypothetical protein
VGAPAVSVLITVFNGEKYLGQTLDSLLAQRFQSFEVICGNDCSSDGSLALLEAWAKKDARIRPFTTPRNLGTSPKTMNFLLPQVRGARLAYSSQDDLYSPDWLERMHARAEETGAEAVLPDLVFKRADDRQNTSIVGVRGDRSPVLSGREAVTLSLDGRIHAFALWSAALVKEVRFAEFGMNSDEYTGRVLFDRCNRVAFSEGTFYYRQDNPEAITKKLSVGTFDIPGTHLMQWRFLVERGYPPEVCTGELMRCVSSLIWMRQRLSMGKALLTAEQRRAADAKLEQTFDALRSPEVAPSLKERLLRGRPSERVKVALLGANYFAFSLACRAAARARNARARLTS